MAVKDYTLTLSGAAQCLTEVLPAANQKVGDANDLPCRLISFQHDSDQGAAAIYVGSTNAVSATAYGFRIDPTSTAPPIIMGHFDNAPYKLSSFWVLGTKGQKLHILTVVY